MRKLIAPDLFKTLRIMRIAKVDKEIREIIDNIDVENANEREVGVKAIVAVCMAVPDAEPEIYDLIGGIAEREDINAMPLDEFFAVLEEIAKHNDLKSFFTSALRISGRSSQT